MRVPAAGRSRATPSPAFRCASDPIPHPPIGRHGLPRPPLLLPLRRVAAFENVDHGCARPHEHRDLTDRRGPPPLTPPPRPPPPPRPRDPHRRARPPTRLRRPRRPLPPPRRANPPPAGRR